MDIPPSTARSRKKSFGLGARVKASVTDASSPSGEALDQATVKEVLWTKIKPRRFGDVRTAIDAEKVVDYAATICDVGLLTAITLTPDLSLVAGKHRLVAFGLAHSLATDWLDLDIAKRIEKIRKHFETWGPAEKVTRDTLEAAASLDTSKFTEKNNPQGRVSAKILAIDPDDREAILNAEAIENENRKDFQPKDILKLKEEFEALGYVHLKGRPKKGQKSLQLALARCSNKSQRTIQRILNDSPSPSTTEEPQTVRTVKITLERLEKLGELIKSGRVPDPDNLMHVLPDAIAKGKAIVKKLEKDC